MRLSDVLSKNVDMTFWEIEGFLNNKQLKQGKSKKLAIGKIALPFFCHSCDGDITFVSVEDVYCIGVNKNQVSIDCVLKCSRCGNEIAVWFLVDSSNDIFSIAPKVRVLKRNEKFTLKVSEAKANFGGFAELLGKAECAYRNELGAGAIIYLRKIVEKITTDVARVEGISTTNQSGHRRKFKEILQEVDNKKAIIPKEFTANGYKLFGELSEMVHGTNVTEEEALQKYSLLKRLVIGILDNVRNSDELRVAVSNLGWI